jgi:hypothetical protein
VAYESGIKNFWEERFSFSVQFLMIGAKIITTGVLFKNAEINDTGNMILGRRNTIFPRFRGRYDWASLSSTPDIRIPSLTIKRIPTVIMPSLANPANASLLLSIPTAKSSVVAENKIKPGRMISLYKATIMSSITPITIYPSVVSNSDQFYCSYYFGKLKTKKIILIH